MIFDQYSRYKACSDLLRQAGFVKDNSVLDVGSGRECLFGQFMPDAKMSYVDPLIPSGSGRGRITGDVFTGDLDNQTFDCVTAVDVLEHIPYDHRQAFLKRMTSLGRNTLILGFPTSDSSDALETDKAIDEQYRVIFGHDYSWLEEHYKFGLPSLAETVEYLNSLGWHCQTIGHAHAPWLRELLGFVVCVWDIPGMSNVVLKISEKFNRELYAYDFSPPYYRQFVIASRSRLPSIITPAISNNIEAADNVFRALMEDVPQQYYIASLQQLVERDTQIATLNQKIEEVSEWSMTQQATVVERDAQIATFNQKIEEMSEWSMTLQATVVERDAQIATLNQMIEEISEWSMTLQATVAERDAQIATLNQKIEEVSEWGTTQHATVAERDTQIATLNKKIEEVFEWGTTKQATVVERDTQIATLNQKIEEMSELGRLQYEKNTSLQQALSDKHAELMKMSDWAQGMMLELNRHSTFVVYRAETVARRCKALVRKKLGQSFLGDMVRRMRNSRRCWGTRIRSPF